MRLRKDAQAPRIRTNTIPPQREESPESRRLFGAVWGAQPQRSPRGKNYKADAIAQKRTKAAPPAPFLISRVPVTHRDRHKETAKAEVNLPRQITAPTPRKRTKAISTRRNRNARYRKPFCLSQDKQNGVNRRQNAAIEAYHRTRAEGMCRKRTTKPDANRGKTPRQSRKVRREPSAKRRDRSLSPDTRRQNHKVRREPKAKRRDRSVSPDARQGQAPRQNHKQQA